MAKPVERQNHSGSFFILATLIAICTAWSFYDEYIGRRPWKDYQEQTFAHEREKLGMDLRFFERKIDDGQIKVALDPQQPAQTTTVAEARKRLTALDEQLARQRGELTKLEKQLKEQEIVVSDADIHVKFLKSDDDGLFYKFQSSQHEEMLERARAAKAMAAGDKAQAAEANRAADEHGAEFQRVTKEREELRKKIADAEKDLANQTAALGKLQEERKKHYGERDRLKAAIDGAVDPFVTAKQTLETALKKRTELTQYWLRDYDNSVDRCQNCHSMVDRCGYSRPFELVAALGEPDAKPEKVADTFCVNPETLDHYKAVSDDVCQVAFDEAASMAGKAPEGGVCFTGQNKEDLRAFFRDYCGDAVPALAVLGDRDLPSACIAGDGWAKLSPYREDPEKRGACKLDLKPEGETCVEGAARDQLLTYLERKCGETSTTLKGLAAKTPKACASGEQGKLLASTKPVLFELEDWAQTHPHRTELLGSNHPTNQYGCTTCHEGQGAQTKGVAGRHFEHGYDDHYWEKPMLDLVAHKKYRPKGWGPPAVSEGVPGVWVTHERHFVESSCAKCHADEVHLKYADTYARGRRLVAEIGCHGCHPVDTFRDFPRIGPTLTDLRRKTTPEFLQTWIAYPKGFRPRTKMPNFWPESLDEKMQLRVGTAEANQREDEVRKIAAYLWKSSPEETLPELPVKGDPARGQLLVQQVGCRGCHNTVATDKLCTKEQIASGASKGTAQKPGDCEVPRGMSGSAARDFAPNLSNVGLKTNARWLFAWVKNPSSMWAGTRMPNLRLSDQEASDIVSYLLTLKEGPALAEHRFPDPSSEELARDAEEGSKLITKYGCAGCHEIRGHENDPKIGVDINDYGRKSVDLIDFGNAIPNPRHHTWYNFVDLKLRAPRSYKYERVDTRMPQFDLNDDEVQAVMTFLKSRTGDKVPAAYLVAKNDSRVAMAQGDQVMEYFNCRGCHVVDGQGGNIRDIFTDDDLFRAPPILQSEGWRVQPGWLFGFLNDPSDKLRPWLDVRMPTFPLGDDRATKVVKGFSATADKPWPYVSVHPAKRAASEMTEAKALFDNLRCVSCHIVGTMRPDQDPQSAAPNLVRAKTRLRPDWILGWLKNPQALQDGTRMPSFFQADDMSAKPYPNFFGGDQAQQIEALRDYVVSLGEPAPAAAKSGSSK